MADLTSSLILLPAIFLANKIDFTDPTTLLIARVSFVIAEVLGGLVLVYLRQQIIKNNDDRKIVEVKKQPQFGQQPPAEAEMEIITVQEYDQRELKSQFNQLIMRVIIMSFLHFYFNLSVPLVIQLVSIPVSLYKSPLVKVYIFGAILNRPFPQPPSPFDMSAMMKDLKNPKEDKQEEETEQKNTTINEDTSKPKSD
eukprot:TRINITY_DN15485_c0_g1_i1.p1 TRINITY_DN15485_c0_g1~~TRINITY_DN15485_c0_g1_i1.p1  ORF type:complete len:197 (-),score=46.45 TRINITY_DN15485_c0_g1_i1:43-633(-)